MLPILIAILLHLLSRTLPHTVIIFRRIDRPSLRDPFSLAGQTLEEVSGAIEVYNVNL